MPSKTFRSRSVVRWAVAIGALCALASVPLFVSAVHSVQEKNTPKAQAEAKRLQSLCDEQAGNGPTTADNPCTALEGAGANSAAKGFIGGGVLLVIGAAQLISALRMGVTVAGPGVVIRNPLRTYRLRWAEIKAFGTEDASANRLNYAFARVDLLNGESHRIESICMMPWESKSGFRDRVYVDELNAELADHHSTTRGTEP